MEVSAKKLRRKPVCCSIRSNSGEEMTITYRGLARVRVVRIHRGPERAESVRENELFGLWASRDDLVDPRTWIPTLRRSRYP